MRTIDDLPVAGPQADTDRFLVRQGGTDARMTLLELLVDALRASNNLSDLDDPAQARTNLGIVDDDFDNFAAVTDPTAGDDSNDGYKPGSRWFNTVSGEFFLCASAAVGAAVWIKTSLTLDELGSAATQSDTKYAHRANNLADLPNIPGARNNLGLGTAAIQPETKFAFRANNLADLPNIPGARANLGLGGVPLNPDSVYLRLSQNLNDLPSPSAARTNLGFSSPILNKAAPGTIGNTSPGTVHANQLILGGGKPLVKVLYAQVTLNFGPNLQAGATDTATFTLTGVTEDDVPLYNADIVAGIGMDVVIPPAGNQIRVNIANHTQATQFVVSSIPFTIMVLQV